MIIRSEHQYRYRDLLRRTVRKHLYELEGEWAKRKWQLSRSHLTPIQDELKKFIRPNGLTAQCVDSIVQAFTAALNSGGTNLLEISVDSVDAILNEVAFTGNTPTVFQAVVKTILRHAAAPAGCQNFTESDVFGRYLGFVDLRLLKPDDRANATASGSAILAMGLLAAPKHLRHDPSTVLISGEHGAIFGVPNFSSTFYAMHAPNLGGAYCAQACVVMALGALSDRGSKLAGTFEITVSAKTRDYLQADSQTADAACIGKAVPKPASAFLIQGMVINPKNKIDEFDAVLSRSRGKYETSSSTRSFLLSDTAPTSRRKCRRLLQAYIDARYPVIALVNSRSMYRSATPPPHQHAVLIVGGRQRQVSSSQSRPTLFELEDVIVHDPGFQPFLEIPVSRFLEATVAYDENSRTQQRGTFVFVGEKRLCRHAFQCVTWLEKQVPEAADSYLREDSAVFDYRVQLVESRDLPDVLSTAETKRPFEFRRMMDAHGWNPKVLWCVVGFRLSADNVWTPTLAWLFDAERESEVPYVVNLESGSLKRVEVA